MRKQSQLSKREKKPGYSQRAPPRPGPESTRSGKNSSFITIIRLSEFRVYSGNTQRVGSRSQLISQRGGLAGRELSCVPPDRSRGNKDHRGQIATLITMTPCPLLPHLPCHRGSGLLGPSFGALRLHCEGPNCDFCVCPSPGSARGETQDPFWGRCTWSGRD